MKARLDGIYSPTLPSGYGELPSDPSDCWIIVHADIGAEGGAGADCFTLYVTTPKFLAGSLARSQYRFGRGLVLLSEFDWLVIEDSVESLCASIEADTWPELVAKLSSYFVYEYE